MSWKRCYGLRPQLKVFIKNIWPLLEQKTFRVVQWKHCSITSCSLNELLLKHCGMDSLRKYMVVGYKTYIYFMKTTHIHTYSDISKGYIDWQFRQQPSNNDSRGKGREKLTKTHILTHKLFFFFTDRSSTPPQTFIVFENICNL